MQANTVTSSMEVLHVITTHFAISDRLRAGQNLIGNFDSAAEALHRMDPSQRKRLGNNVGVVKVTVTQIVDPSTGEVFKRVVAHEPLDVKTIENVGSTSA